MSLYPASFERLTDCLRRLPGVGAKSAQRMAFWFLSLSDAEAEDFAAAIVDAKHSLHRCAVCQNLTDEDTLWPATFCPPSWVAGFLQMSPFMAVFFSCWGCLEEDQTRWVFPELKVLGVLCICGRTPVIERYPTSLLAAGH